MIQLLGQTKNIIEQENGLEDLINQTLKVLEKLKPFENNNINSAIEIINGTKADIEELKNIVNGESLEINQSEHNLEFIEDRLNELRIEARKHNCTVDDLIKISNN